MNRRFWLVPAGFAALVISAVFFALPGSAASGNACKDLNVRDDAGIEYRVLFAKNGAVQRFQLIKSSKNPERDHDAALRLERRFGPPEVNAPPLTIVGFRKTSTGMLTPAKAVDSCGRITRFK
ncbi:MAG: hypothetical protein M3R35_05345 [Candidatus Eremiobacteraeota bacterium]|nr:hypothetical protein [Candidatus Eremiobacteraeota bacterium]